MRAMVLERPRAPLAAREMPAPRPAAHEVLVRVGACAVCRTDLHVVDGDLPDPALPLVPGHEIVGVVTEVGADVQTRVVGERVGIPWLAGTCGACVHCRAGRENLCERARFTGYTHDGGYAEFTVADSAYVFPIPEAYDDVTAAPLLCAGLIGFRAYRAGGPGRRIGLYGFGAAAHLLAQVARHDGRDVYAFTRPGDETGQVFARSVGAVWAGSSEEAPPEPLDVAIIFAPVGALVPKALRAVIAGGTVVCAGIHMSPIPSFPYEILWGERVVRSVANLTREDAHRFLEIAPQIPVRPSTEVMPLEEANEALDRLRSGRVEGALVLVP